MKGCNLSEFCSGDQYRLEFVIRGKTEVLHAIQEGSLPDAQTPVCLYTVSARANVTGLSKL